VTKLRASDGVVQGSFAVGSYPNGVAFDGANIWVSNGNNGTVTKLRASDGAREPLPRVPFPMEWRLTEPTFGSRTAAAIRFLRFKRACCAECGSRLPHSGRRMVKEKRLDLRPEKSQGAIITI